MSSWVLLRPFLLKDCLSFVIQPFKQAQKPNISLAFFHGRQAQKGFTEERCEPTVVIAAKNHRSIRSDSEESLWRIGICPDIPLFCYRIGCSIRCRFRCHIYKSFKTQWKLKKQHTLQSYCSLLCSAHCKQFCLLHLLITLCWAVQVDLKGCLGQLLLSKSQQNRLQK